MKSYPAYKDSGVEWIGEIPEHWEVAKLKMYCDKITDGSHFSPATQSEGVPYVSVKDVGQNTIDTVNCKKISDADFAELERNGCRPEVGDILLTKDGTIGRAAIVEENDFVILSSLGLISPGNSLNNKFLRYYLVSDLNVDQMLSYIHGSALKRLTIVLIKNLIISIPPLPEQTAIANFLDHKTAQLDAAIEKHRQLIELLQAHRAALINEAVTKGLPAEARAKAGLNPDAPMKDSGVEWIGEVPEDWEVKRIKNVTTKIGSGVTPRGGAETYLDQGIRLLRSQNIYFEGLRMDEVAYISQDVHESMANSTVYTGDVLLNITGGSIGRCYFADKALGEANVNQHVCIVRPDNTQITTKYLYFYLRSNLGQEQIWMCQTGANREGLNFEQLKQFILPYPKLAEQQQIVQHIETETTRIDAEIVATEREIELLEEYRQALIAEAVTGKIDVREWRSEGGSGKSEVGRRKTEDGRRKTEDGGS